jgi:hypothetical protein
MLDKLRELATKERKEQEALKEPAVEGEFREMPASGGIETRLSGNPGPLSTRVDNPVTDYPDTRRLAPPEPPKKPTKQRRHVKRR